MSGLCDLVFGRREGLSAKQNPKESIFSLKPGMRVFAVARVLSRVAQGGHNVPEEVGRRRFDSGLRSFQEKYPW
jgi:hypothetical protein